MSTEKILGHLGIQRLELAQGGHNTRDKGVCLMEAVAWFAGETHSDRPQCTDPALGAYGRALNDRLGSDERQALVDLIPSLVGTASSPELSQRRRWLLVDRSIRVVLPLGYRAYGQPEWAEMLESLSEVRNSGSAQIAQSVCLKIRNAYAAAVAYSAAAYAAYVAANAAANAAAYSANAAAAYYARAPVVAAAITAFQDAIALTEVL